MNIIRFENSVNFNFDQLALIKESRRIVKDLCREYDDYIEIKDLDTSTVTLFKKRNSKKVLQEIRTKYLKQILIYYIKTFYKIILDKNKGIKEDKINKFIIYSKGRITIDGYEITWPLDLIDDDEDYCIYYEYNNKDTNNKLIAPAVFENTLFGFLSDIIVIYTDSYKLIIINDYNLKLESSKQDLLNKVELNSNNETDMINEILFYLGNNIEELKSIITYNGKEVILNN